MKHLITLQRFFESEKFELTEFDKFVLYVKSLYSKTKWIIALKETTRGKKTTTKDHALTYLLSLQTETRLREDCGVVCFRHIMISMYAYSADCTATL